MKTTILTALLWSVLAQPALAMSEEQFQEMAAEVFGPVIEEFDIPGLAVGVSIDGRHLLYTYGDANRETGAKVTGDTIFELGSISKLYNVTLAALAEQRGLLDLDASVSRSVPSLTGGAFDRITLMDLATHTTSGLPLQVPSKIGSEAELIPWLASWQPGSAEPMRSYSNVGIGLLGHITAKAMRTSYADAMEGTLFPMLGLSSTYVDVPEAALPRYAYGHSRNDDSPIRVHPGVFDDEAYGVKSTANDMLHFLDLSLGRTDDPDLRAIVEKTQTGQTRTEFYTQGMIWEWYPWPVGLQQLLDGNSAKMIMESQPIGVITPPLAPQRESFLNKTGSTHGFGGYVALLPSEDLGIVVLANRNYPNAERVKAVYGLLSRIHTIQAQ